MTAVTRILPSAVSGHVCKHLQKQLAASLHQMPSRSSCTYYAYGKNAASAPYPTVHKVEHCAAKHELQPQGHLTDKHSSACSKYA